MTAGNRASTLPTARAASVTIPLDAPVETVWRALTDPNELVHWFPTNATVEPRPGGAFVISWDGQWQWEMTITDFEPLTRLRMIDRQARPFDANGRPLDTAAPVALALEITLEPSDRGGTVLRLVHSGFGHGAVWDDELDGVSLGWQVELKALEHYLRHHRGRARCTAWAHAAIDGSIEHAWRVLTSKAGIVASGLPATLTTGDRCTLSLTTGDTIDGRVAFAKPGRQLVVVATNLGDSLWRLSLDRAAGQLMAQVWLSSWMLPPEQVSAFERRMRDVFARLVSH